MKLGNYLVDFKHDVKEGTTECKINIPNLLIDDENIAIGHATCSIKDQFNRRVGRKIALTHALKSSLINKEERKLIWEDYLKLVKH